jgi:hypothetical protein
LSKLIDLIVFIIKLPVMILWVSTASSMKILCPLASKETLLIILKYLVP